MATSESLRPVMLRSTTPAPGEKVLLYLEGMARDAPLPPASYVGTERIEPQNRPLPASVYSPSARNHPLYHDLGQGRGDAGSENAQDDDLERVATQGFKHESFDSGPSFGNLRFPRDDTDDTSHPIHVWQATPTRAAGGSLSHSPPMTPPSLSALTATFQDFQPFALPLSPKAPGLGLRSDASPSVNINIQAPSRGPASVRSHQAFSSGGAPEDTFHPQSIDGDPARPWSPRSQVSIAKSRGTHKSPIGTDYPALPPSRALSPMSERTEMGERRSHVARSHQPTRSINARSEIPSQLNGLHGQPGSQHARSVVTPSVRSQQSSLRESAVQNGDMTPRAHSPDVLNQNEEELVQNYLDARTPRTSYLETEVKNSHFHDMDLCILLHAADDPTAHDIVRKAMRKAVRARIKKLGMKCDPESINQYRMSFHDHDPHVHLQNPQSPSMYPQDPPDWAKDIMKGVVRMQQRLDSLGPKIEILKSSVTSSLPDAYHDDFTPSELAAGAYAETAGTQTVNIQTQRTGDDSIYQQETIITHTMPDMVYNDDGTEYEVEYPAHHARTPPTQDGESISPEVHQSGRDRQYLEEELYKLRVKPASQSGRSHRTWEVARDGGDEHEVDDGATETRGAETEAGLPDILADSRHGQGDDGEGRTASPPLPPLPNDDIEASLWHSDRESALSETALPSWQRIHQRLLNWAIVWSMTDLMNGLNSTTRGNQIDEIALSIWSTQCYKRYVRSKMTEDPPGRVDRLFVPPNIAEAISNAVYHGRHGDACAMLRDLWSPFGFQNMPRLLIVLAKHRSDETHWVVHRFSLPDGSLTSYDTFPGRSLPDGRPLGWWFAIRIAWPNAIYPSPDNLVQKMVRLHRPMQLAIDNSLAAAGIWRNLLMGSRAERSTDLERLRDLINTEVKNLAERKHQAKLRISARPGWDGMH